MSAKQITKGELAGIVEQVDGVKGFLTPREAEFLALLAACPTARGCIVELGTLHGKSTVALARGAALGDQACMHSVDIKQSPEADGNLRRCGVREQVQTHITPSHEFLEHLNEPIRLFWHDGANNRNYVTEDVNRATRLLADGAIVAFHDVLNNSGERLHVFVDRVLASDQFSEAGVVGSIGWAQFRSSGCTRETRQHKERLARGLSRLKPFHFMKAPRIRGLRRVVYETYRQLVPHGAVNIDRWRALVT